MAAGDVAITRRATLDMKRSETMDMMPTYFIQFCPVCGRALQIPVCQLGKSVACRHCRAKFTARDYDAEVSHADSNKAMRDRLNALLAMFARTHA
jgi:uncharacterized paraquat-inducible protein A